jgi:hypothetical protein
MQLPFFPNFQKSSHVLFSESFQTNLPFKIFTGKETERYLGYSFNKSGLVSELKNKLKDLIDLLEKWKQSSLTTLSRVVLLKLYGFVRLSYFYFCDSIQSQHFYNSINNLTNWFLWNKSSSFNQTVRYFGKMKMNRLTSSYKYGGVELCNNYIRHLVHMAFLMERAYMIITWLLFTRQCGKKNFNNKWKLRRALEFFLMRLNHGSSSNSLSLNIMKHYL